MPFFASVGASRGRGGPPGRGRGGGGRGGGGRGGPKGGSRVVRSTPKVYKIETKFLTFLWSLDPRTPPAPWRLRCKRKRAAARHQKHRTGRVRLWRETHLH